MSKVGYSVLFCDCARSEGRAANAPTGVMAAKGFSAAWLREVHEFHGEGQTDLFELNPLLPEGTKGDEACVLVIRGNGRCCHDQCLKEVEALNFDTFAASRGKVVNAHSRHMIFLGSNGSRAPDPTTGLNTVKNYSEVPYLNGIRDNVSRILGTEDCVSGCVLKYPDIDKCGIGWHGDGERRQTIVYRLGESSSSRPLCFQWYLQGEPIGEPMAITLHHGDMCIASEKAVGTDWKLRKVPTLRHATGFLKQGPVPAPTSKVAKQAAKRKRDEWVGVDDETTTRVYGSTGGASHGHGGPGL